MKRRDFLRSAGAAAVIPVLPLPAAAAPVAAAPVNAYQVGWAALYARVNERVTPALLQKWLRLDADQANAMMQELISRNIVRAQAGAPALAVEPMYPRGKVPGLFRGTDKARDIAKQAFDALKNCDADVDPKTIDDTQPIEPPAIQEAADESTEVS